MYDTQVGPPRRAFLAGLTLPWNPAKGCIGSSATPPVIACELAALFARRACRDALVHDLGIVDGIDYVFMRIAIRTRRPRPAAGVGPRSRTHPRYPSDPGVAVPAAAPLLMPALAASWLAVIVWVALR